MHLPKPLLKEMDAFTVANVAIVSNQQKCLVALCRLETELAALEEQRYVRFAVAVQETNGHCRPSSGACPVSAATPTARTPRTPGWRLRRASSSMSGAHTHGPGLLAGFHALPGIHVRLLRDEARATPWWLSFNGKDPAPAVLLPHICVQLHRQTPRGLKAAAFTTPAATAHACP